MKYKKIVLLLLATIVASGVAVKIYAVNNDVLAKKYTRCAAIRMKEINLDHLSKDLVKYTTPVPDGWEVVSGTGGEGHPKLLICQ